MERRSFLQNIDDAFAVQPVVAILGPRQCGKSTLARQYIAWKYPQLSPANYFDLEDDTDLARLSQAKFALEPLNELIVIDEIQRLPDLFKTLRVIVDKSQRQRQFLILGSASRELIQQSSETLAGRIFYLELTPFTYQEVDDLKTLWCRGGFPLSYLAPSDEISYRWRQSYVQTFLEQDIPNLGIRIPALQLRRFWMMLSHYHGNLLNASELGRSLLVNHKTIRRYLDILVGTFMVRELQPWFENISKRQVKTSKIYIRDSGILHFLWGIKEQADLLTHPRLGASWEGFALEEIIRVHDASPSETFFWNTQAHSELDLLIMKDGKRLGFEFKYTVAPKLTKSMVLVTEDLRLDQLIVIYPGDKNYRLAEKINVCGVEHYIRSM